MREAEIEEQNETKRGHIVLRFMKGLLDKDDYRRLKEQAAAFSTGHKVFVMTVENKDAETLAKMVTPAAIFLDAAVMDSVAREEKTLHMLKKLSVTTRQILSHYKAVSKDPHEKAKTEIDCRLSIVTPSAHIHLPENASDKKYERCVREALLCADRLSTEEKDDMLVYYDRNEVVHVESKSDYVRRVYAGIASEKEKGQEKE